MFALKVFEKTAAKLFCWPISTSLLEWNESQCSEEINENECIIRRSLWVRPSVNFQHCVAFNQNLYYFVIIEKETWTCPAI